MKYLSHSKLFFYFFPLQFDYRPAKYALSATACFQAIDEIDEWGL
jgi:hypothetical protein